MQITEVRVKLMDEFESPNKRLLAFCSIVIDCCFVVRDLKIIDGKNGLFVSMPDKRIQDHCPECDTKNALIATYCSRCGYHLGEWVSRSEQPKLFADVAHPITLDCRRIISDACLRGYDDELQRSSVSGYVNQYDMPVSMRGTFVSMSG